jgi:hypothetical protein
MAQRDIDLPARAILEVRQAGIDFPQLEMLHMRISCVGRQ